MFYDLRIESSRYLVCFLFLLTRELENELDLSLYSLSPKTSRYVFSDDNRLAAFGFRLVAFMLPLQQKFEFQNIRHAAFHIRLAALEIRLAAFEIRIAAFIPVAYCPKSS